MKKIISMMFVALMCAVCFSSCTSSDDVIDDMSKPNMVGTYTSVVDMDDASVVTYTLNKDASFVAVETDVDTNEVDEMWGGTWTFDEGNMSITFNVIDEDDTYVEVGHVSTDYKTFTIIDDDGDSVVYIKM